MNPIICIGENLEKKEQNETQFFLNKQIENILKSVNKEYVSNIILAYEPIWAIGTGRKTDPIKINNIVRNIRIKISLLFSNEISKKIRIIYGGSISNLNAESFLLQKEIDGILVGKYSLEVKNFLSLTKIAQKIKK
ncbi:triosephosphate isomerase [Candidatus Phytoplasma oryzae]|uniref:Triosephosphate isomerase n=1 Tax=Candidatus Phytoplasma oryzae TaxID=203274 RepID=A0A139JQY2_9MOLU|nr:triosephosphate isomerase [Candidatus Phytoplasma oryzae]